MAIQLKAEKIPFVREFVAIPGRKYRVDFLIDQHIALEVNGGTWVKSKHSSGVGLTRDAEKLSLLTAHGYRTIVATGAQVKSGEALRWVKMTRDLMGAA